MRKCNCISCYILISDYTVTNNASNKYKKEQQKMAIRQKTTQNLKLILEHH